MSLIHLFLQIAVAHALLTTALHRLLVSKLFHFLHHTLVIYIYWAFKFIAVYLLDLDLFVLNSTRACGILTSLLMGKKIQIFVVVSVMI